jgi:hypothetical protein
MMYAAFCEDESAHSVDDVTGVHTLMLKAIDGLPRSEIQGDCQLTLHFNGHKNGQLREEQERDYPTTQFSAKYLTYFL